MRTKKVQNVQICTKYGIFWNIESLNSEQCLKSEICIGVTVGAQGWGLEVALEILTKKVQIGTKYGIYGTQRA